jgi:hypothetical protein
MLAASLHFVNITLHFSNSVSIKRSSAVGALIAP